MSSPAVRKPHLLHRRDREDASRSPPPAIPFHSPSPHGFAVPDRPAPWTSSSLLSRSRRDKLLGSLYDLAIQILEEKKNCISMKVSNHTSTSQTKGVCCTQNISRQVGHYESIVDLITLLQRLFIPVLCLRVLRKMLTSQATESRCPLLKEDIFSISLKLPQQQVRNKDIDYEVKVTWIDADIRILKLQDDIVQHDPEYALVHKYTSKLLRPSELIEMCLKRGRELSLNAFQGFFGICTPENLFSSNLWMHVLQPIIDVSNVAMDYIRRKYPGK